jgi:hypothetical protein
MAATASVLKGEIIYYDIDNMFQYHEVFGIKLKIVDILFIIVNLYCFLKDYKNRFLLFLAGIFEILHLYDERKREKLGLPANNLTCSI